MGWAEGIKMGGQWYDDYQTQQRQKKEDAWVAENRDRKRGEWTQTDKANAVFDEESGSMMETVQGGRPAFNPRVQLGLAEREAPQTPNAIDAPTMPAPGAMPGAPMGAPAAPMPAQRQAGLAPAPAPVGPARAEAPPKQEVSPEQKQILSLMRVAQANRDMKGMAEGMQALRKLQIGKESSELASTILDASPKELNTMMGKVSLDPQNKFEIKADKNGYNTIVKLDGAQASLTRYELAQYFAAQHRLKNGDMSALDDIGRINKDLAAKVKEQLSQAKDMATTNNTAANHASDDRYKQGMLAVSQGNLGLARNRDKRANEREEKSDWAPIGVSQDGKGLVVYNKRTHETKNEALPPGTDAAGLFKRLTGAGGERAGKDEEVKPPGTIVKKADGRLVRMGPLGEELDVHAPPPEKRDAILDNAGIPKALAAMAEWDQAGRVVKFNGDYYDSTNPEHLRELKAQLEFAGSSQVNEREAGALPNQGRGVSRYPNSERERRFQERKTPQERGYGLPR